jgi:cytochrome c peroxidase
VKTKLLILLVPLALTIIAVGWLSSRNRSSESATKAAWTPAELATLQSLWIEKLPPAPKSPSNRVADNPEAAKLGHYLFFDTRLSKNGNVACATCHQPDLYFTDGLPTGQGLRVGDRNTQTIVGAAYSPWFFWDGRKDSLWSQALAPLENPLEHGGNRFQYATLLSLDTQYRQLYETVFGPFPDLSSTDKVNEIFVNVGKAIAAYERLMIPKASRYDNYVEALVNPNQVADELLTRQETEGLRLFIGKAQCINCHNGPLFTNNAFHNTGILPASGSAPGVGRAGAIEKVQQDPFNCLGQFSDDQTACDELLYLRIGDDNIGAHKTPSLRALNKTEPYMHAGQIATLREVLEHYNEASPAIMGHNEALPLKLSQDELEQLEAFLLALQAPIDVDATWLQDPVKGRSENSQLSLKPANNY